MIDKVAQDFCYINTKANRRKLTEAVFFVPRNRTDLLPYYARLIATLKPGMPDIAAEVVRCKWRKPSVTWGRSAGVDLYFFLVGRSTA